MDSKGEKQGGRAKSRYQGMKAQSSLPVSDPEQFQGFQLSVNKIHRTGEWSAKQTGNSHFLPFLSTVPLEKCALHGIKCTEICRCTRDNRWQSIDQCLQIVNANYCREYLHPSMLAV